MYSSFWSVAMQFDLERGRQAETTMQVPALSLRLVVKEKR